jgi:predicted alpha/beta-fold hydrolase
MGANVMAKYLGEEGTSSSLITAAVCVNPPLKLYEAAE